MGIYFGIEKKSGGFYFRNGYMKRLCLGYFAITYIPDFEFDKAIKAYIENEKQQLLKVNVDSNAADKVDMIIGSTKKE